MRFKVTITDADTRETIPLAVFDDPAVAERIRKHFSILTGEASPGRARKVSVHDATADFRPAPGWDHVKPGYTFESASEAAAALGVHRTAVAAALRAAKRRHKEGKGDPNSDYPGAALVRGLWLEYLDDVTE